MDKEIVQGFKRVDMKLSVMEERIANLEKKSPVKTKKARPANPKEDRGAIGGRDVDVRGDLLYQGESGMNREQKLVDLCFEIALLISDTGTDRSGDKITLYKKSNEEKAEWIAQQLRLGGFDTVPSGMSWGKLK